MFQKLYIYKKGNEKINVLLKQNHLTHYMMLVFMLLQTKHAMSHCRGDMQVYYSIVYFIDCISRYKIYTYINLTR